jgi:uncharacterized phage protein (TIGR02220 family)
VIVISWFKVHRSVFDHWVSTDAEAFLLWQFIIGMAAYEPTKTIQLGRLIDLLPGQFLFRGPQLADRLHIDRNKIYRLLSLFEQEDMISIRKIGKRYSIITVKNYSVYQGDSLPIEKKRETKEKPKHMELCGVEGSSLQQSEKQMRNKKETIYKNNKINKNKENNICASTFEEIISYLNQKINTNYRPTSKATQKLISARINEGFSIDDFKRVIDNKVSDWNHEPAAGEKDMRPYLRPETLFGTKFESYLNSRPAVRIQKSSSRRANFQQRDYDDDFYEMLEGRRS